MWPFLSSQIPTKKLLINNLYKDLGFIPKNRITISSYTSHKQVTEQQSYFKNVTNVIKQSSSKTTVLLYLTIK